MELGWIDFSKSERDQVFNILDLLGEDGLLDELGIAPIRDGFSELLFPGTSTIQTRAKYFLIIPYILKTLELNNETNDPSKLNDDLERMEIKCAKCLLGKHPGENGIIGRNAILNNGWVQRPPSNIYLAGLRKYGIFNFRYSILKYFNVICSRNKDNQTTLKYGNSSDKNEFEHDDFNAGVENFSYLNIPIYTNKWHEDLEINLNQEEGEFLKKQIIKNCEDSMLAYILKEDMYDFIYYGNLDELDDNLIDKFPPYIQKNYRDAISFSEFVNVLIIRYNLIVSNYENKDAIAAFEDVKDNLKDISDINFSDIMAKFKINSDKLRIFLDKSKELMFEGKMDDLDKLITNREIFLKGRNRARSYNPGKYGNDKWFGGDKLNYRFYEVKVILGDIFKSQGVTVDAESK